MTITRRSLLGGGAALAGAAAANIATGGRASASAPDQLSVPELSVQELSVLDLPVMLSVTNAKKGDLEILIGEQAITFNDKALVAKLARTSRKAVV